MKTAVIGGGAAGFFLAVNLKEMMPEMQVTIFERSQRVLAKVEVSGGGRCNCTNSFRQVRDLQQVYPRGYRLMKRLFNVFNYDDAYSWFERHGVPLVVQDDECVFPEAQDSHAVIDCFLSLARRYGIEIRTHEKIQSLDSLRDYDFVAVTTGGSPRGEGLQWLAALGHEIEPPVPSLFSLAIDDPQLTALQGLVVNDAAVLLPGTKLRAEGPLLITHWGVSGPAILRLSSYAARHLADADYRTSLSCLLDRSLGSRAHIRWAEINKKDMNRLVNVLQNDTYDVSGRAPFHDEFVTCGGISLKAVNPSTLESRHVPHLYLAGEVLDIDGVTGGFNFQAAWTTAYVVAKSIVNN